MGNETKQLLADLKDLAGNPRSFTDEAITDIATRAGEYTEASIILIEGIADHITSKILRGRGK